MHFLLGKFESISHINNKLSNPFFILLVIMIIGPLMKKGKPPCSVRKTRPSISASNPNNPPIIVPPIQLKKLAKIHQKTSGRKIQNISDAKSLSPKFRITSEKKFWPKRSRFSLLSPQNNSTRGSLIGPIAKKPGLLKKNYSEEFKIGNCRLAIKQDSVTSLPNTTQASETTQKVLSSMCAKPIESDSSYSSAELENDVENVKLSDFSTLKSVNSLTQQKFNSPFIRKQSSKLTTVGTLISEYSFKTLNGTLNTQGTIVNILDEMNTTPSVAIYNDLKIKLITKDPILEGVHGLMLHWKVVKTIGMGSFGQVIKAINIDSGKIFAVKRLFFNPENFHQQTFINSLLQEVSILQRLKHPHIVRYLGSETVSENYCLYMEYLSGGSLSKLIYKVGALAEVTVKAYVKQIVKGLAYLHENGIIHRDLKSDNLLLDSNGKIKLCDFGCSKRYENDVNESGIVNSMKGSLPWMAPEVMKQGGYGRKADIWSLGCVVIEMLTGKPPWGEAENQVMLMMKVVVYNEQPQMPANISDECKNFISMCLHRDPTLRKSAKELLTQPFLVKKV